VAAYRAVLGFTDRRKEQREDCAGDGISSGRATCAIFPASRAARAAARVDSRRRPAKASWEIRLDKRREATNREARKEQEVVCMIKMPSMLKFEGENGGERET